MSERIETHDFMSVDSFSQLPFIRPSTKPSPAANSTSNSSSSNNIRLFGFDLPPDHNPSHKDGAEDDDDDEEEEEEGANAVTAASVAAGGGSGSGSEQTGRKFECHYCCRNFPTSQALGGHQNAHKRERQHAKRAHLQSAMAAAHHQHHHHPPIAEGHVYGILNYHRFGSGPSAAARFGLDPPPHYPSWSSSTSGAGGPRFHGLGSASQPINGNPLPAGLWRVPGGAMGMVVHRDSGRSVALPNLLAGGIDSRPARMGMGGNYNASSSASSSSSPSRRHDSVSLDLHL